jgi:hypothetical protein
MFASYQLAACRQTAPKAFGVIRFTLLQGLRPPPSPNVVSRHYCASSAYLTNSAAACESIHRGAGGDRYRGANQSWQAVFAVSK